MVERICPRCDAANPSEHAYCGQCGAAFDQPLARRPGAALAPRSWQVPDQWRQAGKVVALGAATIVAEVGLAWLQRRQQQSSRSTEQPKSYPLARTMPTTARVIGLGWRISETWQDGQLQERVQEQVMWLEPLPRQR
ncbi:MAG TPA: zinc ribbon domain-containing protein [Herpetosiphonaceae bacterium]